MSPNSCTALAGWSEASNNGWTGAGTASDYSAFAGVAAGLLLAVLIVALQSPMPEGMARPLRLHQRLREQTMAVGLSAVLVLIGTSFLFAQATGESTCAAQNIDITVIAVPLGAGVVGIFVLSAFISDLLGLRGVAGRVVAWCVFTMATFTMLLNTWSAGYLLGIFRSDVRWTGSWRLVMMLGCTAAYGFIYRRSVSSTEDRDRRILALVVVSFAVLIAAIVTYVAVGTIDYQQRPDRFPVWVGLAVGLVSMVHGGFAIWAAPLALGEQQPEQASDESLSSNRRTGAPGTASASS